jgi:hypothetical protein
MQLATNRTAGQRLGLETQPFDQRGMSAFGRKQTLGLSRLTILVDGRENVHQMRLVLGI